MSKRPSKDSLQHWFDELEHNGRGLTKWEEEFISDIKDQFTDRGTLSEKQEEILERIYANKT